MNPTYYYVIIPVFNRKGTTLKCLRNLQRVYQGPQRTIVVVDDGSTDGTSEAIQQMYPEIEILQGDGNLWWSGAIRLGMDWVLERPDFGGVFWLNDDCRPPLGLIDSLIQYATEHKSIAAAQSEIVAGYTYGGHHKTLLGLKPIIAPANERIRVDAVNGNCVAIPRSVVEFIGTVSNEVFPQNFGDSDYSLRASKMGIPVVVFGSPKYDNDQNMNVSHRRWSDCSVSIASFISTWKSPRSTLYPPARLRFFLRHWGIWGVLPFLKPYVLFMATMIIRHFR